MEDQWHADHAAREAERTVLDSLPVSEAMEYLAKHPASAHAMAPLLYLQARQGQELRESLGLLLSSMPIEVPEVGRVFHEVQMLLDG